MPITSDMTFESAMQTIAQDNSLAFIIALPQDVERRMNESLVNSPNGALIYVPFYTYSTKTALNRGGSYSYELEQKQSIIFVSIINSLSAEDSDIFEQIKQNEIFIFGLFSSLISSPSTKYRIIENSFTGNSDFRLLNKIDSNYLYNLKIDFTLKRTITNCI